MLTYLLCLTVQGGKNRRRGKNENDAQKRELELADEEQSMFLVSIAIESIFLFSSNDSPHLLSPEYAQVEKATGSGRLEIQVFRRDENSSSWAKETRIGLIRGSLRKKVWIGTGDIVLVATRDYQEDKLDVVHKYFPEEVQDLKSRGLLPADAGITVKDGGDDNAKESNMVADSHAAWEFGAVDQDVDGLAGGNVNEKDKLVIDDI